MALQRSVTGVHVPNQKFYHIEQMLRAAGPTGAVTILHLQMFNDPLFGGRNADNENENWYWKMRHGHPPQGIPAAPERFIHVRMYHPNWTSLDPVAWGKHTVELLRDWKGARTTEGKRADLWQDPFVGVSVGNEMNLHYECGDPNPSNQWKYQTAEHYAKIAEWEDAVWAEIDRLMPGRKALRVQSALAFGHEPAGTEPGSEYAVPRYRQMLDKVDILAAHPYCFLARPWGVSRRASNMRAELEAYCEAGRLDVLDPSLALTAQEHRFYTFNHEKVAPSALRGGDAGATWGSDAMWYILNDFRPKGFKNANDPGGLLAQVPHKPILFTEAGTFAHSMLPFTEKTVRVMRDYLKIAADSGRCIGVTWFIWNSGPEHQDNLIWPNESLRNQMENMSPVFTNALVPARGNTPAPQPEPQPKPNDFVVGPGFRDAMRRLGTSAVMHEQAAHEAMPFQYLFDSAGNLMLWRPESGVRIIPSLPADALRSRAEPRSTARPHSAPQQSIPIVELDGIPLWNQLDDWNSDADGTDENRFNNCLAQSCAMVVARTTGVELDQDSIKDWMRGEKHLGNLYVSPDGVRFLNRRGKIPTRLLTEYEPHNIRQVIQQAILNDFPVCVLYTFVINGRGVNHFAVAYGFSDTHVILANPWGGTKDVVSWPDFERAYLKWAIVCQRPRDEFLRQSAARQLTSPRSLPTGGSAGLERA